MRRASRLALLFLLPALCSLPRVASAQLFDNRAWSTYLRAATCNDLLCQGDTIWMATGEAGLLRYLRSTKTWLSTTREPNGLAGNTIGALALDRSGNLFAAVPGKGVSRLGTDGRWSLINAFDGLPSDTTLSLRAEGDTMWMGTTRGLALWNGSSIAGAIPDRGTTSPFGSNQITGIVVLHDSLVVSTPVGFYLARHSERLATWTPMNAGLPLNPNVKSLGTDGRTMTALVSGQNPNGSPVTTSFTWSDNNAAWGSDFPPNNAQVRRVRDENGTILITTSFGAPGSDHGEFKRGASGGWIHIPDSPTTDNADQLQVEVGMAADGKVFSSTLGLLFEEPPAGQLNSFVYKPPGPVGNAAVNVFAEHGSAYACYDEAGLSRLRNGVWRNWAGTDVCSSNCDTTFQTIAFPTGVLVEPRGYKWVGVWSGQVTRFDDEVDPPRFINNHYPSSSPDTVARHTFVWSAAADSNKGSNLGIWFGLDSANRDALAPQGIDVYDSSGAFVRSFGVGYPGLRNGQIRALAVDRTNTMWVGYAGNSGVGLSTFQVPDTVGKSIVLRDVDSLNTKTMDCFGIQIFGDSVWVLATDGLKRFSQTSKKFVTRLDIAGPPVPRLAVHPLAVAPDGSLFVGTTSGLRWHQRGRAPIDLTPDNSPLADVQVRSVFVEPSGVVWIATTSGVNRFDPHYEPPPAPRLPSLNVTLYPNPAWRTGIGFQLKLRGQATHYEGEVYDVRGRLVHRFAIDGNDKVMWDGFDLDRRGVDAGVYFLRVRGGGAEATSKIVVLR